MSWGWLGLGRRLWGRGISNLKYWIEKEKGSEGRLEWIGKVGEEGGGMSFGVGLKEGKVK